MRDRSREGRRRWMRFFFGKEDGPSPTSTRILPQHATTPASTSSPAARAAAGQIRSLLFGFYRTECHLLLSSHQLRHKRMAFLLNKTCLSQLRLHPRKTTAAADSFALARRGIHVEPGPREKALLAEDPVLKRFKSYKKSVWRLKKIGDALTIIVVAGCCYEIYVKAVMREEARKQASDST